MDFTIFSFLFADGIQSGVLYGVQALALVLVFAVTKVIMVPLGELMMFAPLTFAVALQNQFPGTAWLSAALLLGWAALEWRNPKSLLMLVGGALAVLGLGWLTQGNGPGWLEWLLSLLIVLPMGPATYRLFFETAPRATVLVYLIIAIGLHFVYQGLGLVFFGPEKLTVPPALEGGLQLGVVNLKYQTLLLYAFTVAAMVGLFLFFTRSIYGKALQACAVNRLGARISGINPRQGGRVAVLLATVLVAVAGLLMAPIINPAYYLGFNLGLKGFVAAIIGGLISYPVSIVGALLVGLMESFTSFYASALKEALVFALLLPVLLVRSLQSRNLGDED